MSKRLSMGICFCPLVTIGFDLLAITRRTITPFPYQTFGAFVIRFGIGFVVGIVNPNVEKETVENLGTLGALIDHPYFLKKV